MKAIQAPVLICGGGPVGLSAAILLARLGVRSVLVERHPSTTDHPKARGFFTRTMEILLPWGIEASLREHALPSGAFRFIWVESLTGREIGRVEPPQRDIPGPRSPTYVCMAAQDAFEAELRHHADTYPEIALWFKAGRHWRDGHLARPALRADPHSAHLLYDRRRWGVESDT